MFLEAEMKINIYKDSREADVEREISKGREREKRNRPQIELVEMFALFGA